MVTVLLNKLGTPVRLSYRKGDEEFGSSRATSQARPQTPVCASQCRLMSTARRAGASHSNYSCRSLHSGPKSLDKSPVYVFAAGLRIEHFPDASSGPRQAIEAYPLPGAAMALTD